jgi:hypothetical protein
MIETQISQIVATILVDHSRKTSGQLEKSLENVNAIADQWRRGLV